MILVIVLLWFSITIPIILYYTDFVYPHDEMGLVFVLAASLSLAFGLSCTSCFGGSLVIDSSPHVH
jgi:hypothetical protein